jgi:predicted ATPase
MNRLSKALKNNSTCKVFRSSLVIRSRFVSQQHGVVAVNNSVLMQEVKKLIEVGVLKHDEHQKRVIQRLSHLQELLKNFKPPEEAPPRPSPPESLNSYEYANDDQSSEACEWRTQKEKEKDAYETALRKHEAALDRISLLTPRGMYLWGDVGTGKRYEEKEKEVDVALFFSI